MIPYAIIAPLIFIAGVSASFTYLLLLGKPPSENQGLMVLALGAVVGVIAIIGLYQGLSWLCHKEDAPGPSFSLKSLLQSMVDWVFILLALGGVVLVAFAFSFMLRHFWGVPYSVAWIVGACSSTAVLFAVLYLGMEWSDRKRMNFTVEGNVALEKIAEDLREDLQENNPGMVKIQGGWSIGYLKIFILFVSDEVIQHAKASGLLDRIGNDVGEAIRNDPAFGRNRELFDPKQAICATSNPQYYAAYLGE